MVDHASNPKAQEEDYHKFQASLDQSNNPASKQQQQKPKSKNHYHQTTKQYASCSLRKTSGVVDTHRGWPNDGHSLLISLLDELPCKSLRDAFCYDGYGPDLED